MTKKTTQIKKQNKKSESDKKQEVQLFIPKYKNWKKKSQKEIKRIQKSKKQKIFLLNAVKQQLNWSFEVLGSTGSNYHIIVQNYVSCTCIDFLKNKKPCKHIYFIIIQIAQSQQILQCFIQRNYLSKKNLLLLSIKLQQRLKSRYKSNQKGKKIQQINLKDDIDCPICFMKMQKGVEELDDCETCCKFFHLQCINIWKTKSKTCPLCRSLFLLKNNDQKDPLSKLLAIKI